MVETRRGTLVDIDAAKPGASNRKQPTNSDPAKGQPKTKDANRKRKQEQDDQEDRGQERESKEAEPTSRPANKRVKKEPRSDVETNKPRLTSPELEFDYDRSKLRDPRETPGRKRRPRYEDLDIPDDLKADLSEKFHIVKPEQPKGRLTNEVQSRLIREEALTNPLAVFHNLHICHKKGRDGSPTYDSAGFELDWEKVDDWQRPKAYSKSRMMNGMDRALEKKAREDKEMCRIFFKDGKSRPDPSMMMMDVLKDHVSKDLGVSWHQIGPEDLRRWEEKGFEKQDFDRWWHQPNEEEKKRFSKMHAGCKLRKHQ